MMDIGRTSRYHDLWPPVAVQRYIHFPLRVKSYFHPHSPQAGAYSRLSRSTLATPLMIEQYKAETSTQACG
jgi:hypothetical protein